MTNKVAYTKRWTKNGETRVFINFEGSGVATFFVTGNKFNPKGTWELNGCTKEDIESAKKDPRFFDQTTRKWNTYYPACQSETQPHRPSRGELEDARRDLEDAQKTPDNDKWLRMYADRSTSVGD